MAHISPVTGRYVTMEVMGDELKVFFLENGSGQPLVCQHTAGCHNHQWVTSSKTRTLRRITA
jgi:hypothetical protein